MCTRPDHRSVPSTIVAVRDAFVAVLLALAVLIVALGTAPVRWLRRRRTAPVVPAPVTHVDIQIHLDDARCVAELKRVIRQTLRRSARTWAPIPLPVDRVVVGVGFPSAGKVDLYDRFPGEADHGSAASRGLVVISLGLRDGERELEPAELAGALAAQIQAAIDDRYRRAHTEAPGATTTSVAAAPTTSSPSVAPVRPTDPVRRVRSAAASLDDVTQITAPLPNGSHGAALDPPGLQEFLARQKQDQPLVAAGPSANGTHP